jgi:hypothetical protein
MGTTIPSIAVRHLNKSFMVISCLPCFPDPELVPKMVFMVEAWPGTRDTKLSLARGEHM